MYQSADSRLIATGAVVAWLSLPLPRHDVGFGIPLVAGCAPTIALYLVTAAIVARFGITL